MGQLHRGSYQVYYEPNYEAILRFAGLRDQRLLFLESLSY